MNFSIIALNVQGEGRVSSVKPFETAVMASIKTGTILYRGIVFIFGFLHCGC